MVAGLLLVVTSVLGFLYFVRWRGIRTPGAMMACLPRSGAVLVYIDMHRDPSH
jgi:hypothetical protein